MSSGILNLDSICLESCNFCNGTNIVADSITGENVCTECGVVYENLSDYAIRATFGKSSKTNMLQNFISSTTIQNKNIDCNGAAIPVEQVYQLNRLRKMDKFTGADGNFERNIKDASHMIGILRDRLSLTETIIDSAYNKYIKIVKAEMIKGRSIKAFVAASIYSACKDANVPRTLKEISDVINANSTLTRKCYTLLIEKLEIDNSSSVVESNVYLARAANKSGLSNKTLLKSIEIWSKIKDNPEIAGKKPTALSMAILYYASTLTGERITKTKMADACNMSKVTLNKRVEEIERLCQNN